jgi:hypothetical protein
MRLLTYVKENPRFTLVVTANAIALCFSTYWLWTSNFEMEPIVSSLGLLATLLGLNYINDKLSKPHLKVSLSMSVAKPPRGDFIYGINVTIENHSVIKAFIKHVQVELPNTNEVIPFLYEGFTDQPIPKIVMEPGQSFSFNIAKKNLSAGPHDPSSYGKLVVTTDIGYKFIVPAKIFQQHYASLFKTET